MIASWGVGRALLSAVLAVVLTGVTPVCASVLHDDRGVASVTEVVRGTPVRVSHLVSPVEPAIAVVVGTPDRPRSDLSFEEMSAAVDSALGQLDADARLPQRIEVQPASLREPLLRLLRQRLNRRGANWNPETGTVRAGQVYHVLADDMLAVATASPLAAAFANHGYHLTSTGTVNHVEVGRVDGFGRAKLPTEIQDMGLVAIRERP